MSLALGMSNLELYLRLLSIIRLIPINLLFYQIVNLFVQNAHHFYGL